MKRRGLILVIVLIVLVVAGAAAFVQSRRSDGGVGPFIPVAEVRAPDGVRVRVQVLNATKTRGLARRATRLLRDRGFDVVETGTLNQLQDTTLVLDLTGHPDWAKRVGEIFTPSRVSARADSSRYLDIAVVLGSTWKPPSQPFYP